MDAGRRHDTHRSDVKDVITISNSDIQGVITLALLSQAPVPTVHCTECQVTPAQAVCCIGGETLSLAIWNHLL